MISILNHEDAQTARQIRSIQLPAYQVEAGILQTDRIPRLYDSIEDIQSCEETFVGFFRGDVLVGFISYKRKANLVDIHRLVVFPPYFRQGIAKSLLTSLLDILPSSTFKVSTGKNNMAAQRLYHSLGFQKESDSEAEPGLWLTHFKRTPKL
ncbi:GNAT family N-acetyltransferase [Halobacillus shinanisalinarum]|uniref:GNAT family N-acetyltransferase n=1 Tax=Halobacillus shinanisalinarum TaxID=2932258 RepID=A0ABY4GUP5_9BACI|nr:GNAT family N-acetyltransferase [Halobacillus shinanisalinarum]UOQ91671.1 GNAT family N-acetyltransferase [Halobacillus shinanisalinarum]